MLGMLGVYKSASIISSFLLLFILIGMIFPRGTYASTLKLESFFESRIDTRISPRYLSTIPNYNKDFPAKFTRPTGVAIDSAGNIFVSDFTGKVQVFGSNGYFFKTINLPMGSMGIIGDVAIDKSNNLYVLDKTNYKVNKFNKDGDLLAQWSLYTAGIINNTRSIAVSGNGLVYVVSEYRVRVFDDQGVMKYEWGSKGSGVGQFVDPGGISIDRDGNVYVADTNNNRIQVFNPSGVYLRSFGSFGVGVGQLKYPEDVLVVDKTIFVADTSNSRVQAFDLYGNYISSFNTGRVFRLGVDNSKNLYIVKDFDSQVIKYTQKGEELMKIGLPINSDGKINNPEGVSFDLQGNVLVSDKSNNRYQLFTVQGDYIEKQYINGYQNAQIVDAKYYRGYYYVVDNTGVVTRISSTGEQIELTGVGVAGGDAVNPYEVAFDRIGNMILVDSGNNRIQKFRGDLFFDTSWGGYGTLPGQFDNPKGIAIDDKGDIYVVDSGNNRVQKFNSRGKLIKTWGDFGNRNGQFNNPHGIAIIDKKYVAVVDTGNNRVQIFDKNGKFQNSFGSYGIENGKFVQPKDIAISRNVLVVSDISRVQVFSLRENILLPIR